MMLSKTSFAPRSLSDLPNISIALAEALRRVGLTSCDALTAIGAEHAWRLLLRSGFIPSIQSVLALEGAIEGVPWQELPAGRRNELVRFAARTSAGAN